MTKGYPQNHRFVGTFQNENGSKYTSTVDIWASDRKEAVDRFLKEYKPLPYEWEYHGIRWLFFLTEIENYDIIYSS